MLASMDLIVVVFFKVDGVRSYSKAHFWQLKSDLNVASVHVQATPEANAQLIRHKVRFSPPFLKGAVLKSSSR